MAEIVVQSRNLGKEFFEQDRVWVDSWALAQGDTATPISRANQSERSIQLAGTWGGATVVLQGSNDGVTWFTLTDPAGAALSFTANGLKQVMESVLHVKPAISGGDGTTAVVVTLLSAE
jgi:hypothetical protein